MIVDHPINKVGISGNHTVIQYINNINLKKLNVLNEIRNSILQYISIGGNSKKYKIEEKGIYTLQKQVNV